MKGRKAKPHTITLNAAALAVLERAAAHRCADTDLVFPGQGRSEENTSELQSLMRISYAVFCLKKNNTKRKDELLPLVSWVRLLIQSGHYLLIHRPTYMKHNRQNTNPSAQ